MTLELYATDRKVNIIESGFDAGIRYSQDVPKEMIAIPFGEKLSLIRWPARTIYAKPESPIPRSH